MQAILTVNHLKDLQLETDVSVIVLPVGEPIGSHINRAWAVDCDE